MLAWNGLREGGSGTYAERYGWAMKMARMAAPLRMTMRESPGLKQLEF
jgi:hypothetical protein